MKVDRPLIFDIEYKHRTTTVIGLCLSMRNTGDYNATPILADALQDADFDNEAVLEKLRLPLSKDHTKYHAMALVAQVYIDNAKQSLKWLEEAADKIADRDDIRHEESEDFNSKYDEYDDNSNYIDYSFMLEVAEVSQGDRYGYCFNSDSGAEYFYDDKKKREFFDAWTLISGSKPISDAAVDNIQFRCSC